MKYISRILEKSNRYSNQLLIFQLSFNCFPIISYIPVAYSSSERLFSPNQTKLPHEIQNCYQCYIGNSFSLVHIPQYSTRTILMGFNYDTGNSVVFVFSSSSHLQKMVQKQIFYYYYYCFPHVCFASEVNTRFVWPKCQEEIYLPILHRATILELKYLPKLLKI